jgi:hypothetical protein
MEGGPSTSWTTTVRQEDQTREAEVEGEVVSRREAPRRIQEVHPLSKIIGDIDERTTRSRSRNPLISLMLHLLPPLSPRTLETLYLMQTGSILCMRSWKTLRGTRCGS